MNKLFFSLFIALLSCIAFSQNASFPVPGSWVKNISGSKVFIQNKGQFDKLSSVQKSAVLFGTDDRGSEIYFTAKGLIYRFTEAEKFNEKNEHTIEEEAERKEAFERERKEKEGKAIREYFIKMEWTGASPSVQVIADENVPEYFSYSNPEHPALSVNNASAFKKITYKNLYPGVDVEYFFHAVEGIKYNLLLHPGADVSQIGMKYTGAEKLFSDKEGNIHLRLKGAAITDHAPRSFCAENNLPVSSSFKIKNNTVAFVLGEYNASKEIVIDPWTTTVTSLATNNRAFDIGKDAAGNVYIGGGRGNGTGYKVAKYSSAGTLIWTNNTGLTGYWGDMVTDPSGNCYVSEGAFSGNIIKVNNAGALAWTTQVPSGSGGFEAWALAVNECNPAQVVVTWYDGSYNVRLANLNLATGATAGAQSMGLMQPKEIRSLCIAPNGDVHGLSCSVVGGGSGGNYIFGGSNNFVQSYLTQSGYAWDELSPLYSAGNVYTGSGINAIAADNCYVYTTNGVILQKRNKNSGAIISSTAVPGGIFERNGGIAVDSCGNIYVGSQSGVYKFDSTLVQSGFSATPAAVYDVRISSIAGEILACGDGFVASLSLSACQTVSCSDTIIVSVTPASPVICRDSSVILTATGADTYTWSPAAGLSSTSGSVVTANPGATTVYTVTGSKSNGCATVTDTTTVTVSINSPLANITSYTDAICGANNGSATVTASGGNGTYAYLWSSGETTATANNLMTGMYVVTVTSGACSDTASVFIDAAGGLSLAMQPPADATCGQNNGSAAVTVASGNGPFSYIWSNGDTTSAISNLGAGIYTVTVTGAGNCSDTASVTINASGGITLTVSSVKTTCGSNNGAATVSTGGITPTAYNWSNGAATQSISNLAAGTYTVTVTAGSCTATAVAVIDSSADITISVSSTGAGCTSTGTATVSISGGTAQSYAWSNGGSTQTITNIAAGTYAVTVTSTDNCTDTASVTVGSSGGIVLSASSTNSTCGNSTGSATVTVTAGTATGYSWSNGGSTQTITNLAAGNYTVTVTGPGGCSATASIAVADIVASAVNISGSLTYCPGGNTTLTATGGSSYAWSNGSSAAAITVTQGTYTVTATDTSGCTATAAATVSESTGLTVTITGNLNYCTGSNTTLTATGGASYAWSNAATTASITVTQGTYSVTAADAACSGTASAAVTESAPTPVILGGNITACNDSTVIIHAGNGHASYAWSTGETAPSIQPQTSGTYTVTATDANSCTAAASVSVSFRECPEEENILYIPNAFTPNDDGNNDLFLIEGRNIREIEIKIFNRWGELVYSSQNHLDGWDGTYKKAALPVAVYVYHIKAKFINGEERDEKGSVTLIR